MAIGAYEVAKQKNIPCLYVDTQHEAIVSLVKDIGIRSQDFFHMKVPDYMKIYRREPEVHTSKQARYRKVVEQWEDIACLAALSDDTPSFTKLMRNKKQKVLVSLSPATLVASPLVRKLEERQAIKIQTQPNGVVTCEFTSKDFARFLGSGDWLEIYVWHEAKEAKIADDCQWGYKIKSAAESELDVVFTYRAQLIFAECKTDDNPFQETIHYLDTISSKAEMLGGKYVTKIFITNASKTQPGYPNFLEQAKLRKIVVATAEDLPNLKEILKREAITPTFPRI